MYAHVIVTRHQGLISYAVEGEGVPTIRHLSEDQSLEALEDFLALHGLEIMTALDPTHAKGSTLWPVIKMAA